MIYPNPATMLEDLITATGIQHLRLEGMTQDEKFKECIRITCMYKSLVRPMLTIRSVLEKIE